jgi:hypothetical protein
MTIPSPSQPAVQVCRCHIAGGGCPNPATEWLDLGPGGRWWRCVPCTQGKHRSHDRAR